MKSERPDLSLTIARLVRNATPVTPLASPAVRLTRWAIWAAALAVVSVAVLGVRSDAAAQLGHGWFAARAAATLVIVIAAAGAALIMAVPGIALSRAVRGVPLAACVTWAFMLIRPIARSGSPFDVLLQVPPHPSCVLLIVATALLPGLVLVRMLRRAAPLDAVWTTGLAGLASLALGALGAQFVCANDAAAHHLLWHFAPVAVLTVASAAAGPSLMTSSFRRPFRDRSALE